MSDEMRAVGSRKDKGSAWLVYSGVEERFADIGRAVADAAVREIQERAAGDETPFEGDRATFAVGLKVWPRFSCDGFPRARDEGRKLEARSNLCCPGHRSRISSLVGEERRAGQDFVIAGPSWSRRRR